jgi:hypothetical protein
VPTKALIGTLRFSDLYDQTPDLTVTLANAQRNLGKTRVSASEFIHILDNQSSFIPQDGYRSI